MLIVSFFLDSSMYSEDICFRNKNVEIPENSNRNDSDGMLERVEVDFHENSEDIQQFMEDRENLIHLSLPDQKNTKENVMDAYI